MFSLRNLRPVLWLAVLCLFAASGHAARATEDLLPEDTLAFATVADMPAFRAWLTNGAATAHWREPAMAPFLGHFASSLGSGVVQPLEAWLGIPLGEFADLATGPATVALVQDGWTGTHAASPALIACADVGDATNKLAKRLRFLTREWSERERPFGTNTLRETPFYTWTSPSPDHALFRALAPGTNATVWHLGQSGSLLLLSTSASALERVLERHAATDAGPVALRPRFATARTNHFTGALVHAWLDGERLLPPLRRRLAEMEAPIRPETLARFLGLTSVQSAAFALKSDSAGTLLDFAVASPVARREGLPKFAKILAEDSRPLDFIPASALGATRLRLDLKGLLSGLETFVVEAEPAADGALRLILDAAGKDEDPGYDLRSQLLEYLGDDLVFYQPAPSTNTLDALLFPPRVVLLGSPAPGRLANALRVLANTLSPEPGSVSIRTVEGARLHRARISEDEGYSFAPIAGHVAISADEALVEALLKPADTNAPALRTLPGLAEAANRVGGFGNGWFSYENPRESLRLRLEGVQQIADGPVDPTFWGRLWALLGSASADTAAPPLFDFKRHPSIDTVARHLGFTVAGGESTDDGFRFRMFKPAAAP
jgi:hypothetical protein